MARASACEGMTLTAITNIRDFTNNSSRDLFLLNLENPEDTDGSAKRLPPHGGVYAHDMWIPWYAAEETGAGDLFGRHHIALWDRADLGAAPVFFLWQDFGIGRACVRYATTAKRGPEDLGDPVPGDSAIGGDRSLVVTEDTNGRLVLQLFPYTLPLEPPGPIPFTMRSSDAGGYSGHIADGEIARVDYRISGIGNRSAARMRLAHTNFSDPVGIPPAGFSHAFDGQPLTGGWHADVEGSARSADVAFYVV